MIDTDTLILRLDAYKAAAQIVEDTTVSHRVFGDTKKLGALRHGGDITVRRFNAAMTWLDQNWPKKVLHTSTPNQELSHDTSSAKTAPDAA